MQQRLTIFSSHLIFCAQLDVVVNQVKYYQNQWWYHWPEGILEGTAIIIIILRGEVRKNEMDRTTRV